MPSLNYFYSLNHYRKTPFLQQGVNDYLTANKNNWENSVIKNKNVFESSFFSLLNEQLVLNYWKLYLIEISLRKKK